MACIAGELLISFHNLPYAGGAHGMPISDQTAAAIDRTNVTGNSAIALHEAPNIRMRGGSAREQGGGSSCWGQAQ